MPLPVTRADVDAAWEVIRPHIRRTPVIEVAAEDLGLSGPPVAFKLEFLQHTGSFKARGAMLNLLTREVPPGRRRRRLGRQPRRGGRLGRAAGRRSREHLRPRHLLARQDRPDRKLRRDAPRGRRGLCRGAGGLRGVPGADRRHRHPRLRRDGNARGAGDHGARVRGGRTRRHDPRRHRRRRAHRRHGGLGRRHAPASSRSSPRPRPALPRRSWRASPWTCPSPGSPPTASARGGWARSPSRWRRRMWRRRSRCPTTRSARPAPGSGSRSASSAEPGGATALAGLLSGAYRAGARRARRRPPLRREHRGGQLRRVTARPGRLVRSRGTRECQPAPPASSRRRSVPRRSRLA